MRLKTWVESRGKYWEKKDFTFKERTPRARELL
jgi:hypothetical protein